MDDDKPMMLMMKVSKHTADLYQAFIKTFKLTVKPDTSEEEWENGVMLMNNCIVDKGLQHASEIMMKQIDKHPLISVHVISMPMHSLGYKNCESCRSTKCPMKKL